jgi:hypothetical protein
MGLIVVGRYSKHLEPVTTNRKPRAAAELDIGQDVGRVSGSTGRGLSTTTTLRHILLLLHYATYYYAMPHTTTLRHILLRYATYYYAKPHTCKKKKTY